MLKHLPNSLTLTVFSIQSISDQPKLQVNTAKGAADEVVTTQEAVIVSETEKYQEAVAAIQALTVATDPTFTSTMMTATATGPIKPAQIESIIEAMDAADGTLAAMHIGLAMLNQLLAQLQSGRIQDKTSSSQVSCHQLVQTVAQMVSALPEHPDKVLALANALEESPKLEGGRTCSADQISFLTKQRDWLKSQIHLN